MALTASCNFKLRGLINWLISGSAIIESFSTIFLQIVGNIEIYWEQFFRFSLKINTLMENVLQ